MYNECRHIFTGGRKCQSAALKEQNFCYFHSNTRKRPTPKNQPYDPYIEPKEAALELTPLEDTDAIQLALSEVVLALAANRIDARRARILIYGLQVASQNHRHRAAMEARENVAETTVREIHQHEDGTLIGPAKETPDPEEEAEEERPSLGRILLREAEAMRAEREARIARGEQVETITCRLSSIDAVAEPCHRRARKSRSSVALKASPRHSINIGGCRRETTWPTTTCATGSKRSTKPES